MIIVVFFLIFLPVFSALFLGLKVPNPLKKTDSLSDIESLDKQLGLLHPPSKPELITKKSDNTDEAPEVSSSDESETAEKSSPNEVSDANENKEEN